MSIRFAMTAVVGLLLVQGVASGNERGIQIQPDESGRFTYVEDFKTPRFLAEGFTDNLGPQQWRPGNITNQGPHRNRTLTYRFFGDRKITGIDVHVEQQANSRNRGSVNKVFLSLNGLDWAEIASSGSQPYDQNGRQLGPLSVSGEQAAQFTGGSELWVRVLMDNYSGLQTKTSNVVSLVRAELTIGEPLDEQEAPRAHLLASWGRLRSKSGWRSITLDAADPPDARAPHYYENSDGWLQVPGANSHLGPADPVTFTLCRQYLLDKRSPLSMTVFVNSTGSADGLMATINVDKRQDGCRKMDVFWDGKLLERFDVASYWQERQNLLVKIPGPVSDGVHELRIAGGDSGVIRVNRIEFVGPAELRWAEKPALPAGGTLEVFNAYYLPDSEPPAASQVVEGRGKKPKLGLTHDGLQQLYKEYADFGALRVILRNRGTAPVRISNRLLLNGRAIEDSYVDFVNSDWDARGVVWYRVRPGLIQPGRCGQVYVRFRRRPEGGSARVTLAAEHGRDIETTIPYDDPGVLVDYVTTDKSMTQLYIYARRSSGADPGKVLRVSLDGELLENVRLYGSDFPGDVALAVASLSKPLAAGEYHVAGIETDKNRHVAAQFRVLPFMFPRSSFNLPPSLCREMHMNLRMRFMIPLNVCEEAGVFTTSLQIFNSHPRVAFVMSQEEPDAHDNRGGGHIKGLGYHARRQAHSGWHELVERFVPQAMTWQAMNGTVRPLNWYVYGQFTDISCFDPYPITWYNADHAYVRESLSVARRAGMPKRMYAVLEAYGWNGGQGVPPGARGPIPAEYRQNAVQAIGAGMKGLTSWVYSARAGGWQLNDPCKQEIAKVNSLIEHIEDELLLGTPIDLAASDAGKVPTGIVGQQLWPKDRVWVGSLLCGPDTIVLAAANHIPASKPDPPKIVPAKDVSITVKLPRFFHAVEAFEVTENGLTAFPCERLKGTAVLRLDAIESGRVFVLRSRIAQ